jgi:hypothetical protein
MSVKTKTNENTYDAIFPPPPDFLYTVSAYPIMEVLSEIPGTILFFNTVTPYFNPFIYPTPPVVD